MTASEGGIYRRFGYGVATRLQSLSIDRSGGAEIEPLTGDRGDPTAAATAGAGMRLMSDAEARPVLPAVWERYWTHMPGEGAAARRLVGDAGTRLRGGP